MFYSAYTSISWLLHAFTCPYFYRVGYHHTFCEYSPFLPIFLPFVRSFVSSFVLSFLFPSLSAGLPFLVPFVPSFSHLPCPSFLSPYFLTSLLSFLPGLLCPFLFSICLPPRTFIIFIDEYFKRINISVHKILLSI